MNIEVSTQEGIDVSTIAVGDEFRYKVTNGRGRPAVGKVIAKNGLFIKMENLRTKEVSLVKRKMLTTP